MERSAGILLPIFSLPGRYGIGSLGAEARAFAQFLRDAGQRWWQILPVGPTAAGDSPYTGASTFAGNPLLIDLDALADEGLLDPEDLASAAVPEGESIDYGALYESRGRLLHKAYRRARETCAAAVRAFAETKPWLGDYVLYQEAKRYFRDLPWYQWPEEDLRRHEAGAVERWRRELAEQVEYRTYVQYWFFTQWTELKKYVNGLGIGIVGDLPFYVSLDSADVWAEREMFLLDRDGAPSKVAGVPPDYFSEEGQLWGNPLYDWTAMRRDGFGWWIRRVDGAAQLFDAIRIDHFRGLESYWAIPAGAGSARDGAWEKGPGMDLLGVLRSWFPQVSFIAEDLGILTDAVHALRDEADLPGMKVLEFAFSGPDNAYLPHHYPARCVCYTGTHDNDTAAGWYAHATAEERAFLERYLGVSRPEDVPRALVRCGMGSTAELFVAQMQDYLGLGSEARINVPGVASGNWRWRMAPGRTTKALAREIRTMTETFSRC